MAKKIDIVQNQHEFNVANSLIKKLYDMVIEKQSHNGEGIFDDNSSIIGEITLSNPTYEEWVNKIHEVFPSLEIHSQYYILFKDSVVESMMVSHLLSKGIGDGIGITEANASNINVTDIPRFTDNTEIEYFDELVYFTRVTGFGDFKFSGCSNLKTINIQNITGFGYALFNQCVNLKSVVLNPLVKQLPYATFSGCESLESVNTEYIMTIGDSAFRRCKLLTSINSSNLTSISQWAFESCSSLETIDITNVTTFGSGCFDHCTSLQLGNNNHLICTTIPEYMFDDCPLISSLYIPNVTGIDRMAFCGCTSLTGVFQSSNVTYIKDSAFYGCKVLYYIDLSNCTSIGFNAFHSCETLTNIDLSAAVTIEHDAFRNCKGLTSINLSSVTTLGREAFAGCTNLSTIILNSNFTSFQNPYVFDGCGAIDIDLSNITGSFASSFRGCTLESLTLSPNLTALAGLASVKINSEVIIPESVTLLKSNCLENATIPSIKFLSSTPPTAESSAMHNFHITKIKIPAGSLSAYKNADGDWTRYSNSNIYEEY